MITIDLLSGDDVTISSQPEKKDRDYEDNHEKTKGRHLRLQVINIKGELVDAIDIY